MHVPTSVKHVVIVGGGFAGLWAARGLAHAAVRITLLDRCNHHLFQPLLYQVATAGLSGPDIAAPLRHILRGQANVHVLLGEVERVEKEQRRVYLADGQCLDYDWLVLASGSRTSWFGQEAWAAHAPGLKTLDDALDIRRRLLLAFEQAEAETDAQRQRALLNFIVIGGGPTGVELAGVMAEIARHTLRREFRRIDPAAARVLLLEAGPRILSALPEDLSRKAASQLTALGVEVRCGQRVVDINGEGVRTEQEWLPARTVLWAAGVAASPLGASLQVEMDRAGRVKVGPDLSVPGWPEIYVAGDLAAVEQDGKAVPGVAPAAKQMGAYIARSLCARLQGSSLPPFRYQHAGSLATIGRKAAVADLGRLHLSGLLAWWFWLLIHVLFLIGFRNRLIVLLNWAWSYWTWQRHSRIILGHEPSER